MVDTLISRRGALASFGALAASAVVAKPASADEAVVTRLASTGKTYSTLWEAIDASVAGDTIQLLDNVNEYRSDANLMYQIPVFHELHFESADPDEPVEFRGCLRFASAATGSSVSNISFFIDKETACPETRMQASIVVSSADDVAIRDCTFSVGSTNACVNTYGVYAGTDSASTEIGSLALSGCDFYLRPTTYACGVYLDVRNADAAISLEDVNVDTDRNESGAAASATRYFFLANNSNASDSNHYVDFKMSGANTIDGTAIALAFMPGSGSGTLQVKPGSYCEGTEITNCYQMGGYFPAGVVAAKGDFTFSKCGFDSASNRFVMPDRTVVFEQCHSIANVASVLALDDAAFEPVEVIGAEVEVPEF